MKKALGYILLALVVASCSNPSDIFVLKGKFKNFNQGELYVYSLAGRGSIDTVRLAEGKFTYDILLEDTALLSVVFPNFSEIPVVAIPGAQLSMQGDASHLREVTVTGTTDNDELTTFRLKVADKTPPEAAKDAAEFIKEHPASPACLYVLNRYFLVKNDADYNKADELLKLMAKSAPADLGLQKLQKQVAELKKSSQGKTLPAFTVTSTAGTRVSNSDLNGDLNVVTLWATWSHESRAVQRDLFKLKKDFGQRLKLLSICLDADREECRKTAKTDSMTWSVVCDGKMWQSPVVSLLGFSAVPDNIVIDRNGKIISRRLSMVDLRKEIEDKLKKK